MRPTSSWIFSIMSRPASGLLMKMSNQTSPDPRAGLQKLVTPFLGGLSGGTARILEEGMQTVAACNQPGATGAGSSHLTMTRSSLGGNWRRDASSEIIAQGHRPELCIDSFAVPITSRAAR